jgi:hypothetical protein
VSITGNFHSGEDVLAFSNTSAVTYGNIAASYNAGTGVLTLTSSGGIATLAQWQAPSGHVKRHRGDAGTVTRTIVSASVMAVKEASGDVRNIECAAGAQHRADVGGTPAAVPATASPAMSSHCNRHRRRSNTVSIYVDNMG